jgi:hypothetical protein
MEDNKEHPGETEEENEAIQEEEGRERGALLSFLCPIEP